MSLSPCFLLLVALGYDGTKLFLALVIKLLNLREDDKRIVGIASQILDGVDVSPVTKWCSVRLNVSFIA